MQSRSEYLADYRKRNADRISAREREYNKRQDVKDRKRAWSQNYWRAYYEKNKKRLSEAAGARRAGSIKMRIRDNIRRHVRRLFESGAKRDRSSIQYVGCTVEQLRAHLESGFSGGMSWENYGFRGWHIDHIKPISAFDLSKESERLAAMHYTNLQPLWWRDNLSKGGARN